jgi:hypothetical protein
MNPNPGLGVAPARIPAAGLVRDAVGKGYDGFPCATCVESLSGVGQWSWGCIPSGAQG